MTADERKSETDHGGIYPRTAAASTVCACGVVVQQNICNDLERELTAANEQIKRVREETIEEAAKVAENPKMKWHLDLEDLDYPWKKRENREQVRIAQEIRALKC